ncbi:MAG: SUF system NifU family Fe-S cluster assembly protein [Candidatus Levybacteria bacterium]|nr:SUF system NifU family Fe-S cluster assembly protein [Candidatus Levybacteria bacterium]
MDFSKIYREEILEHYKEPLNFGTLEDFDMTSRQFNPFCGDEIVIFVTFQNDKISDIRFQGKGCAISVAAASMLTEHAKGRSKEELTKFTEDDMLSLIGIDVSETRKKCVFLALGVLKDCLVQNAKF